MLAGALVRSIRSESNRESQVEVEAGSGRLRPSPSRIPHRTPSLSILFSRIPFSPSLPFLSLPFPNERTNELCLAPSPLFSSLSRCRSLNRSSCSRLRNSRSLTVQQVIFFQLSPSARLPSPVFFCPSLPTSLLPPALLFLSFGRVYPPSANQSSFSTPFRSLSPRRRNEPGLLPASVRKFFTRLRRSCTLSAASIVRRTR